MKKTEKSIKLLVEIIIDDVEYLNIEEVMENIRGIGVAEITDIEILTPKRPNIKGVNDDI